MRSPRFTLAGGKSFLHIYVNEFFNRGSPLVERLWSVPGVSEEFKTLSRQILPFNRSYSEDVQLKSDRWVLLPGLICQAAGGYLEDADIIAMAWLHFYLAAQLMDSVQDLDDPEPWWKEIGGGGALNVASGLFFIANLLLSELNDKNIPPDITHQIIQVFNQDLLLMCSGQHIDLTLKAKTLEDYWRSAGNKSGSFFALACKSGALLAAKSAETVNDYRLFGYHLGMLIQILDDLEDWHAVLENENLLISKNIKHTLPIVYTLEVLPEVEKVDFLDKLGEFSQSTMNFKKILEIVERAGASIFLFAEMQKHFDKAKNALRDSKGRPDSIALLEELLASLLPERTEL